MKQILVIFKGTHKKKRVILRKKFHVKHGKVGN